MVAWSAIGTTRMSPHPPVPLPWPLLFLLDNHLPALSRSEQSPKCVEAAPKDSLRLSFLAYPFERMSKSRSTTPIPNTFPANITSPASTNLRTDSHEHTPSNTLTVGGEQLSIQRPIHLHSLPPLSSQTSQHTPSLVRPSEDTKEQPMAKRLRRESPQTLDRPIDEPSPSSVSQDDVEEMEKDDDKSKQPSQASASAVPPPKKKRTRTLTTPHQSAVLHALLAQSRFPTTAMREEVGRSIGLSARKVQIWFQNQRQKARRPRSQSEASRRRFPQYGPFPSGPETSTVGTFAVEQGSSSHTSQSPYASGSAYPGASGFHSSEPYTGPLESPTQLLGPGMPGLESPPDILPQRPAIVQRPSTALEQRATSRYVDPRTDSARLTSPQMFQSRATNRPTTTSRLLDRDFSRTLPPLIFNPASARSSFTTPGPSSFQPAPPTDIPPRFFQRSDPVEATFAHQPPEVSSSLGLTVLPPYALQTTPQWDSPTFGSTSLRSPSWVRQASHYAGGSSTPPALSRDQAGNASSNVGPAPSTESVPPQRSGRYDPVRATFIHTTENDSQRRSPPDINDPSNQIEKEQGD